MLLPALLRAFYLAASLLILVLQAVPALRTRFLPYGSRATGHGDGKTKAAPPSNALLSLLDDAAALQLPHNYFAHFYLLSTLCSLFWGYQLRLWETDSRQPVAWALMLLQGLRRMLESYAFTSTSTSSMWFAHWILGLVFYLTINVAIWIEGPGRQRGSWLLVPAVLTAHALQHSYHAHLYRLRTEGKGYQLPSHPMFPSLLCPHYTCEVVIYALLSVIAAPLHSTVNWTLLCGTILVATNLGVTAVGTKQWYLARFGAAKIYWGTHNSTLSSPRNKINNLGLSRKHLIEATAASLARLQLSYVDILYAHRPDRHTPIEETVRAFNHLIATGQTLYWGTSEWLASEIEEAWAVADRLGLIGPIVEQPGYSLLRREKVDEEFANAGLYTRRGLALTTFSPLQGGLLTGKYVDGVPETSRLRSSDDPYIQGLIKTVGTEPWQHQQEKIKKLMSVAERVKTDVATLSMAWVLSNANVSSAITGASRPEQIFASVRALAVYRALSQETLREMEEIVGNAPKEVVKRVG